MKIATFNVAWARPDTARFAEIRSRILREDADIVCLTETHDDAFDDFECILSGSDTGYRRIGRRRKVVLASRAPWIDISTQPVETMPPGRFVSGRIECGGETVTVVGVCIPWSAAHVSTGRKDRARWEDHIRYLDALATVLQDDPERMILVGDFNQTVPRTHAPIRAFDALSATISERFDIVTAGLTFDGRPTIDHVAISRDLAATERGTISNEDGSSKLSDHFGVIVDLSLQHSGSAP